MKKRKNILIGVIAIVLCFTIVGCGGSKKNDDKNINNENGNTSNPTNTNTNTNTKVSDKDLIGTWEYTTKSEADSYSATYEFIDGTKGKKTEVLNEINEAREFTYKFENGMLVIVFDDGDGTTHSYSYKYKVDGKKLILTDEFEINTTFNKK